jgi:hypothetical protein
MKVLDHGGIGPSCFIQTTVDRDGLIAADRLEGFHRSTAALLG